MLLLSEDFLVAGFTKCGARCTSCATGRDVALASAPRARFLKVALPLRRGAHVSLANSSSA
eukprot:6731053-Pyramimonas_sp.AAC.1